MNSKTKFVVNKPLTKMKTALAMNIATLVLIVIATILLFGRLDPFDFPQKSPTDPLKYFTTLSNLLMGLICIIMIIVISLHLSGKYKKIHKAFYILDLVGVVGVALTLFTVVLFLAPLTLIIDTGAEFNFKMLMTGSNLVFHVLAPIASIITFVAFFNTKEIKLVETLYGLIPMFLYSIFYMSVALTHIGPDGKVPVEYDWYRFCMFGVKLVPVVLIIMYGGTFLIAWLLWLGNRKIETKKVHFEFTTNIAIFLMSVAALVWMGVTTEEWYYTVRNLTQIATMFMGTVALMYIIYLSLLQAKKIKEIPQEIRVIKLVATTTSALVLITALTVMMPFIYKDPWNVFGDDAIFSHLLIPCLAIISYICVEHTPNMKFRYIWWTILPIGLYSIFYLAMNLPHVHADWTSDPHYDWYFVFSIFKAWWPVAIPIFVGITYLFGWLLWLLNRNIHPGLPKAPKYKFKKKVNH